MPRKSPPTQRNPAKRVTSRLPVALFLAGCAAPVPPLAQGLPLGVTPESDQAFDERVRSRFPLASAADILLSELRREHFVIVSHDFTKDYELSASRSRESFPCKDTWRVYWNVKDDKISALKGTYSMLCL
jgi:hypothetical protein